MSCIITSCNALDRLRQKFTVERPQTIKEIVAAWAFDDAETPDDVLGRLEYMDCAGCYSPAPIYNDDMAAEIARFWPEIDVAIESYRDATGEHWTPGKNQNFLCYLWFAYEWLASELASQIRSDYEGDAE